MKKSKDNKGIAFIMVMLLIVVVGTLSVALMTLYNSNIGRAGSAAERNKAFYAAEAGVNYLSAHINKNSKEQNIVLQPVMEAELRNLTGDLDDNFFDEIDGYDKNDFDSDNSIFKFNLADDLKINDFNISFSFDEEILDREDEIYGFIIEANNGQISEKIRLTFEIQTLPPFFRSSRQANRINVDDASSFSSSENFPGHSFATAEQFYDEWQADLSYSEGDMIYYNGDHYWATSDHDSNNNNNPGNNNYWEFIEGGPDLRNFDSIANAIDYGMDVLPPQPPEESWVSNRDYLEGSKVSNIVNGKEKYFIAYNDNPSTEPGVNEGWRAEWSEYYNYKNEVVDLFDDLINDYGGEVYSDNIENDYKIYDSSKNYNEGDIVLKNGSIQERKNHWFWGDYWSTIDSNPDLGYRNFLNDNLNNKGPFIKIDGDFTPTESFSKRLKNMNPDESGIVHILVDGDINFTTSSNLDLLGNQDVIMYVNGDLNFNPGFINIGNFDGQLAYFAPNATFNFENQSNIGFGSSMVVNELNLINSSIREVSYDTESSPLIGRLNPKVAELSRSFATQHGEGTVSQINPVQRSWEQIR